jgi:hypothetical protein
MAQPNTVPPSLGGYPDIGNGHQSQQQAWSPAPPAPFPPLPGQAPQHQPNGGMQPPPAPHSFGYPNQQPEARTEPSRRPPDSRLPDPSAYDLGNYGLPMSPQAPSPPTGRDVRTAPPLHQPQQQAQAPNPAQWPPQQYPDTGFGRAPVQTPPPQQPPAYQPPMQAPQPGYLGGQPVGHQPGMSAGAVGGYQSGPAQRQEPDDEDIEVDEPPRRRRRWMIAAALVGSIGVGSGMAYAYKLFLGPKVASSDGKGQLVRASKEPVKVAPADRGGKQFANTDSRVLNNRVPSEGSSAASGGDAGSSGTTDSNGVRRVATVPVGPAGAVPGMMVVGPNGGPGVPPSMMEPPRSAPPPPPPQQFQPPVQPQRVAAVQPPVATPPPAPPRQPIVRAPQPAVEAEPVQKAAAVAPKPPATDRPKPISGYVAVLGFQKSQLEAMKMMADLQQKYEPLRDKRLEIVQSDQTSRGLGVIYRVVVGPRGGITPVRELCSQLQAAGMSKQGCYPLGD